MGRGNKPNKEGKQVLVFCAFMATCWNITMCEEIRTVGYDFEQIVTTSVFSLSEQEAGCARESRTRKKVTKVTIIFHESNEIELRFCHYQASYTVQHIKKSNVYDDGLYLHQESKILLTFYLLSIETCQSIWTGEGFKIPGFGNQEFKLSTAELNKMTSDRTENTETFDDSAVIMKGKGRGSGYAYPVERTTPLGETIVGSVMINARLAIGKVYARKKCTWTRFYSLGKTPSVMNNHGLKLRRTLNMIL